MDCATAKSCIRREMIQEAQEHISACEDCRRFAADFSLLRDRIREIEFPADETAALVARTLPKLQREMKRHSGTVWNRDRKRAVTAVLVAVLFAPFAVAFNYWVASGGAALLGRLLFPAAGSFFFASYIFSAAVAFGFAYGSIPIFLAASRCRIH
jgi:hypothetical protein